jgi:hypothetical protein
MRNTVIMCCFDARSCLLQCFSNVESFVIWCLLCGSCRLRQMAVIIYIHIKKKKMGVRGISVGDYWSFVNKC